MDALWEKGLRGLLFDLDNTLTPWHGMEIDADTLAWFQTLREKGFKACIVSNGDRKRVQPIGDMLGLPALFRARKPRRKALLAACAMLELPPQAVAMVGDQLYTDILGANRAGLTTILTEIIHPREFWGTRHISRRMERLAEKLFLDKEENIL